jgi:Protein of unknown function (DUF1573)
MIRTALLAVSILALAGACVGPSGPRPIPDHPGSTSAAGPVEPGVDPDPGPPEITGPDPLLTFTARGHDFGKREKNERATHTAVFYNTGGAPLVIEKVKTHCGCAAALLSAKSIPPGGRGTLSVTLNSGTLAGRRQKTVEVFTNSTRQPVATYAISCSVIADAALDPIVLVVRATRSAGEVKSQFDVVAMRPGFDLKVTGVTTSNPDLTTRIEPLPAGGEKTGYRVHLRFGPAFDSRDFTERVTVSTNSRRDPRLTINVIGSVRQSVLVVPERIYYPRLKPGRSLTRSIYVYRNDGKPLTVTGVEDPSGLFETELLQQTPEKWEVKVTIAGEAPTRTIRGSLVILTDAASESRVTLPYEIPGESD